MPLIVDGFPVQMSLVWVAPGAKISVRGEGKLVRMWGIKSAIPYQIEANRYKNKSHDLILKGLQYKHPLLKKILADGGYKGALIEWTLSVFGWTLEIVSKVIGNSTFKVIPKRWVVERTFGWFNFNRRLAKDYEGLKECSVAFVHLTMIRVMLNKIKT